MPKPQKKVKKKPAAPLRPGVSQLKKIEDFYDHKNYAHAAVLALESGERFPNNPEFPEWAVRCLLEIDDTQGALQPLQRLLTLSPDRTKILHIGAVTYAANHMYAHATRCLRRMKELEPDYPLLDRLESIIQNGNEILEHSAKTLNVSFEEVEEGSFWQEEGNIRRYGADLHGAVEALEKAVAILPGAVIPLMLLSEAQFLLGRLGDAGESCRKALELDPNEVEAHQRLLMIARARYDDEGMQSAYAPLIDRETPEQIGDATALAQAHGLMGDHERSYVITRAIVQQHPDLSSRSLPVLGAAAANTGHVSEARGFYRLMQKPNSPPSPELDALEIGWDGPGIAPSFPYVTIAELISLKDFGEMSRVVTPEPGEEATVTPEERAAALERFPQLIWIGEKFLYEEEIDIGLGILLSLPSKQGVEIVRHLLGSQHAPWSARVKAATALKDHGHWNEEESLNLWYEDRWVEMTHVELERMFDTSETPPEVWDGITEAIEHQIDHPRRSERILRGLLERHPDLPILYHNLALLVDRNEAETLLRRAMEIRPDYIYARTTLAMRFTVDRRLEEAEQLLSELPQDRLLSPSEYVPVLYAQAFIHRTRGELDAAIEILIRLLREDPEHQAARMILHQLRDAKKKGPLLLDERGHWIEKGSLPLGNPLLQG